MELDLKLLTQKKTYWRKMNNERLTLYIRNAGLQSNYEHLAINKH